MIGIYKITNKVNGKFYIGQSVGIERRFMEHKTPHGQITTIKLAIRKYGKDNFKFEVLEECKVEELNEKEIYWIDKLKPQYNRCSGGLGSRNHYLSEETKTHLSLKNKQYWASLSDEEKKWRIERMHSNRPVVIMTDEMRNRLRTANIGKKQSPGTIEKRKNTILNKKENGYVQTNSGHRKKVICLETNQIFDSVKDAALFVETSPSSLTHHLKGEQKTCKGKHFSYVV